MRTTTTSDLFDAMPLPTRDDALTLDQQIARDELRQRALLVLVVIATVLGLAYAYLAAVRTLLQPLADAVALATGV